MKFKRINENVIRCVITKEEMYEYGMEVSELVDNRDKAEDFLRKVMQEARYELDYKTNGGALSVQIALLPEGDVAMTIAEAMPDQIENQVNRLKAYIEDFQRVLKQKVEEQNNTNKVESKKPNNIAQQFIDTSEAIWIKCSSLDVCIDTAGVIDEKAIKSSSLYAYKEAYYFRFELSNANGVGELFLSFCEFSEGIFLESQGARIIYEHGRCLVEHDAVATLKNL